MMPEQGDIVLIPFHSQIYPLTKRRPVIVISNDAYNRTSLDMIVVAMTSNPAATSHSFRISSADLAEGALNRPGTLRADKIYTHAQSIVVKKFGKVLPQIVQRIRRLVETLIAP